MCDRAQGLRVHPSWLGFLLAALVAGPPSWAGLEDFINFPETGTSYNDGAFTGRDGSTWTYSDCRGDKAIALPTPCLAKGGPPVASIVSGLISGGCDQLTLNWMKAYTAAVNMDILVNDVLIHTVTGGVQFATNTAGPISVGQAGNFTLKFIQHDSSAGQVAIDNISWTPYVGGGTSPPTVILSPASTDVVMSATNLLQVEVRATEPDGDSLWLWATGLPPGAVFAGATGASPLACTFSWTPTMAQTGDYDIVFSAGDKDGTNRQTLAVLVLTNKSYYYGTEGKTGNELRQRLHEIISTGSRQLNSEQENNAMKDLDTDPANTNNVILLYRRVSMAKTLYNDPNGWNKEHAWPESRALESGGPSEVDVHNLFAADALVNQRRGNLYFDESNPSDPGYLSPAVTNAPETSRDSDSWEPPASVKGDVARAIFYMDVRYDGMEGNTADLQAQDALTATPTNRMGVLSTLLAWHEYDPPDAAESNRNEKVFQTYQFNRNPFIDHPEWVALVFNSTNALADRDGDGACNLDEYIAGSDPTNAASYFASDFVWQGGVLKVDCASVTTGRLYSLEAAESLTSSDAWQVVATTNALVSGRLQFALPSPEGGRHYRLRAALP